MIGLTFAPLWGWTSAQALGLMAAGAAALVGFALVELRVRTPLLDLELFRRSRVFAFGSAAALLNYTAMFASISLTAVLLEVVGGRSPARAGLIMVAQPAVMVALSPFAGRLSDRVGSRALASGGHGPGGRGAGGPRVRARRRCPPAGSMAGLAITGLGMAGFSSPNTSAVMGSAERGGSAWPPRCWPPCAAWGSRSPWPSSGALAAAPLGAAGARALLLGGEVGGGSRRPTSTATAWPWASARPSPWSGPGSRWPAGRWRRPGPSEAREVAAQSAEAQGAMP